MGRPSVKVGRARVKVGRGTVKVGRPAGSAKYRVQAHG